MLPAKVAGRRSVERGEDAAKLFAAAEAAQSSDAADLVIGR